MEQEQYLREQIEFYVDQLDLLGMQENIDQDRIDRTLDQVMQLISQYNTILEEKVEKRIQEIEKRYVVTIGEELEKRKDILAIVESRRDLLDSLVNHKEIPQLNQSMAPIREKFQSQFDFYQSDVRLVEQQLSAIADAEKMERDLIEQQTRLRIEISMLQQRQVSYTELNENIMAIYKDILEEQQVSQIDFSTLEEKKKTLLNRQKQFQENLELAKHAKDADQYRVMYEGHVKRTSLELDKIEEQTFLRLLKKVMSFPVTSYQDLMKRTQTVEGLIKARKDQIVEIYKLGIVTKDEYFTMADQIDHTKIFNQIEDLNKIEKLNEQASILESRLGTTRDRIKGKEELEEFFEKRAHEIGRNPGRPIPPKEKEALEIPVTPMVQLGSEEIIFSDDYDDFEVLTEGQVIEDKKKRQVIAAEPAKLGLLQKVKNMKSFLLNSLSKIKQNSKDVFGRINNAVLDSFNKESEDVEEELCDPIIGDKIHLHEGAMIYSNSRDAQNGLNGYDVVNNGLNEVDLFVTRGVILNQDGIPIYMTTEYETDLRNIAINMGLVEGEYSIILGCSLGGRNGQFIPVSENELNKDIEKGWISADERHLSIIESLQKGGVQK